MQVFKVHHSGSHDLGVQMTKIPGLLVSFHVDVKSHVFISGSVGIEHRKIKGKGNKGNYAIGIGARLEHRTRAGANWIKGSKWGPNIASGEHHYTIIPLSGYITVEAGKHEIQFYASAHTDAPGAYAFPAEIQGTDDSQQVGGTSDPYNQMIVRVEPVQRGNFSQSE